jgi:hypothetical protein
MSDAAHAYERPPDQTVPAEAVREAAGGEVVHLTRDGTPVPAEQVWADLGIDDRG